MYHNAIVITNRHLCHNDFWAQMRIVAEKKPKAVILREKDLSEEEYVYYAKKMIEIGKKENVPIILHSFAQVADRLGNPCLHVTMNQLRTLPKKDYRILGASCHSVEEAIEAQELGATYVTASHIFATECKKGLPPKGIPFLKDVIAHVSIPVYALGGIDSENCQQMLDAGASGYCMMSYFMNIE